MEGRGINTAGVQLAAELIHSEFRQAGLKSGTSDGSFFQSFSSAPNDSEKKMQLQNVVGVLDGGGSSEKETIIVGAHYDHLGFGPKNSLAAEPNKHSLHPGADDNASGVAVVLELARRFSTQKLPTGKRLVFVAFSGEEEGTLGSQYYVAHPLFPLESTITMINFDMVGRVRDKILGIAGDKSGESFDAILDEAGKQSQLQLYRGGAEYPDDSDHAPFAKAHIPILYVCSGPDDDRHKPTDTADKINFDGMIDVTDLMEKVIDTLLRSPRTKFVPRS